MPSQSKRSTATQRVAGGRLRAPFGDALQDRLAATEQLLEMAARVAEGRTVEDILGCIFEDFEGLLPYDRIEHARIEEEGNLLRTTWVLTNYKPVLLDVGFEYRKAEPVTELEGDALPFVERDLVAYAEHKPPRHPARLLQAEGLRSALSCPLVVHRRKMGFLFFCSRRPDVYTDFHVWVIRQVAGQLAGALHNGHLREELAARNRELEELHRFRSSFLAMVSHELRTPLTGVVGLAAALHDQLDSFSPEEVRELAGLVAAESAEAAGIVEDLLVLARFEAGELEVVEQRVDLRAELDRVMAADEGDSVTGNAGTARGDPARIRQILRNLVTNARRYGGARVEVRMSSGPGWASITVADDGPGIPEGERQSVFRPFQRSASGPRREGSVGLGLTVSRYLAERMGGRLSYQYTDGESRFTLHLPT